MPLERQRLDSEHTNEISMSRNSVEISPDTPKNNGNRNKMNSCDVWSSCNPFRLRGTVILQIWSKVLIVTIYTIAVVSLDIVLPMEFTPALVPVLGVVIGFLLVFRTNTAYDRYYEGRKLWSQMTNNVRTITRCIWISIKDTDANQILEKKAVINFAVAFPIAVKHYLRQEFSYDYDDLHELIESLKIIKSKESGNGNPNNNIIRKVTSANGNEFLENATPTTPSLNLNHRRGTSRHFSHPLTHHQEMTNIPLEIMYCIGIYIDSLIARKACDPSVWRTLNFALNGLGDNLGGFERILTTPIPLAYSIHLHHALWIHLLSLPFQLVSTLEWWTVPAVGFTSFTLLGILAIGWEIENPFGHDYNDLPLDDFCKSLRNEVDEILQSKLPTFDDLFLSDMHPPPPLSPKCISASEVSKKSVGEIRILMSNKTAENNRITPTAATKL